MRSPIIRSQLTEQEFGLLFMSCFPIECRQGKLGLIDEARTCLKQSDQEHFCPWIILCGNRQLRIIPVPLRDAALSLLATNPKEHQHHDAEQGR